MQQQRMGVVVIGQSPRPSVVNEIAAVLSPGLEIDLRGALDGMTRAEIDAIPPSDGHDALFTLLPNGDSVTISKKAVEARAAIQIENFAHEGVRVVMLACTGKFPNLAPNGLVILPSAVLHHMVEAVFPKGRLGVFSPLPEQTALIAGKWQRPDVAKGKQLGHVEIRVAVIGARVVNVLGRVIVFEKLCSSRVGEGVRPRIRR